VWLAREAWPGLAGAAHHHAYELAPNASELRGWHTAVTQLAELLATVSQIDQTEKLCTRTWTGGLPAWCSVSP
jgi:uncharacterized protein YukE